MRSSFEEFYSPTPDDEKRFITDATVVVDTNVLIDLYRMSTAQRNEVLGVLEKIGDRLWIPYQVGLEYQRNRLGAIRAQTKHYGNLADLHGVKSAKEYAEDLAEIVVPAEVAAEVKELLEPLATALQEAAADFTNTVIEITERHIVTADQADEGDPVRERLDALFEGRVGARPDEKTHETRVKDAARRYAAQVPPGYKDAGKAGEVRQAGDYLLWAELLDHAEATASEGRPTLFVTNDVKEDWYRRSGGEPIGPQPELRREFATRSANGYHQITLERLLRLANQHLATAVDPATIEKASELAKSDVEATDYAAAARLLLSAQANDAATAAVREFAKQSARDVFKADPAIVNLVSRWSSDELGLSDSRKRIVRDILKAQGDRPRLPTADPAVRRLIQTILDAQKSSGFNDVQVQRAAKNFAATLADAERRHAEVDDEANDEDGEVVDDDGRYDDDLTPE